ncbi:MAG: efflux RND transporter permease subunit, partial [Candidatus Deferrimicrobium sp.]|nr:efflux RND transporter permease subunit [Candidatus Deferrimicrobium sp.]
SLLVSFTLTPMMSARLLGGDAARTQGAPQSRGGFYRWIDAGYERLLSLALRHRGVVALVSVAVMDGIMNDIVAEIRTVPGVRMVLSTAGGGFIGGVSEGRAYIRLAPHEERVFSLSRLVRSTAGWDPLAAFRGNRSQLQVMQEVRRRLRKVRDLRVSVRNLTGFNIGGGSFDIDFVLRGPDLKALSTYAESLRDRQESLGLLDADTTLKLDKPELRVEIDRARAADLRVDPERVGTAVRLLVGGDEEVSRFKDPSNNEDYKVALRLREEDRADPATIGRLVVSREGGGVAQLESVARIERVPSASRIDRLDRQREVRLRASVAPGFAMADRLEALRAAVAAMNLPAAYTTRVSGRGRELERTFGEFVWAFALSIVFMYMILVLFGVVKKNAILQIEHMNNLRAGGMDRASAILQGNRDRLRPILMTTLTFVAGMLPLAVGSGPGAEKRRVIAVVVIGGQTHSLLLTLLATPVVYSLLDDLALAFRRRKGIASTSSGCSEP